MKLVFGNYNNHLEIKNGVINLIYSESPIVFANMVYTIAQAFPEKVSEPIFLTEKGEKCSSDSVFYVGDICMIDFTDKRIVSRALKKFESLIIQDEERKGLLEKENEDIQEIMQDVFYQFHGNYAFLSDWDLVKYMKASGFGIDQSSDASLFDKLIHFMNISIDLFSDMVLCFVNVKRYLSKKQYAEFYELVLAGSLRVLLLEQDSPGDTVEFENYLYIDSDFIEAVN